MHLSTLQNFLLCLPIFIFVALLQFKQAAHQVEAEDIADVLEVQAADAEDAQLDEEADTEAEAAVKVQAAAEGKNLAADAQAKSESRLTQDDPAKANGGLVTRELPHPLLNGQTAVGVTKDVHEADLDLSHADSAPGKAHVARQQHKESACGQANP